MDLLAILFMHRSSKQAGSTRWRLNQKPLALFCLHHFQTNFTGYKDQLINLEPWTSSQSIVSYEYLFIIVY